MGGRSNLLVVHHSKQGQRFRLRRSHWSINAQALVSNNDHQDLDTEEEPPRLLLRPHSNHNSLSRVFCECRSWILYYSVAMSAHGPLARTNTAPVWGTTRPNGGANGLVQTMSHASRSSQMSGTTMANSSSTSLSSMTSSATLVPPTNGGPVQATNNIINQRADASRSLYQICVNLRQRLAQVPGFDTHLSDSDDEDEGEDMDPVSSLWRCLRKGVPLITIYNAIQPAEPLQVDERMSEAKKPKAAAFKFVAACMKDLNLPPGECFALTDLFGDDTTGFVKVRPFLWDFSDPLPFTRNSDDSLS